MTMDHEKDKFPEEGFLDFTYTDSEGETVRYANY
jgi:hypothetical protein